EPGPLARRAGGEGRRPVHEGPDVRLHRLPVLGQERLPDLGDQPLVGEVDALHLHLDRLVVQEVVHLPLGEVADRLVRVEEARLGVGPHRPPAVRLPAGDGERALADRLGVVVELAEVDVGDGAPALALGAHAAGAGAPPSTVSAPLARTEGTLRGSACGGPMCGRPSRLTRMRSITWASVAVPAVARGSAPIRCWSTMITLVSPSRTSTSGRAVDGMKPCTKAL